MATSVIVTGATGFIGNALFKRISVSSHYNVLPVSRSGEDAGFHCLKNYRDTPKGDVLVHAAEEPDRSLVNQRGKAYLEESAAVLDSLIQNGYGKIIYCSSGAVYGARGSKPYTEKSPVDPSDYYVRAKIQNERRVLAANGIVARISNVIGPGMSGRNVASDVLKQLSGSGPVVVRNQHPVCDFIWVEDLIEGLISLIDRGKPGIYNLGSGRATTVLELVQTALNITEQAERPIDSINRSADLSYSVLDVDKMKRLFEWSPETNLPIAIERLINHV